MLLGLLENPRTTRIARLALRRLYGTRTAVEGVARLLDADSRESGALRLLGETRAERGALKLLRESTPEQAVLKLLGVADTRSAVLALLREKSPERAALLVLGEDNPRKAAYHLLEQAASGALRERTKVQKGPSGARLNIGSGVKWRHADWIAVDKCHSASADQGVMALDVLAGELRQAFEPGTVRCIYTAHTLEHFTLAEAARVLRDCFEILAPGAPIRIVVPDLDICVEKLHSRDYEWWADNEIQTKNELNSGIDEYKMSRNFLKSIGVLIEDWYFNREEPKVIRGVHFSAYNFAILEGMLTACGFKNVTKMACGESKFADYAGLDTRPKCSLYVEATR